MIKDVWVSPG